jgi:hypothetical protein
LRVNQIKGSCAVAFRGVIEPRKLASLSKVLDDYCLEYGINDETGREEVAFQIVQLYQRGVAGEDRLALELRLLRSVAQRRNDLQVG